MRILAFLVAAFVACPVDAAKKPRRKKAPAAAARALEPAEQAPVEPEPVESQPDPAAAPATPEEPTPGDTVAAAPGGAPPADPLSKTYLLWDISPLGIDEATAQLLTQMMTGELEKALGSQFVPIPEWFADTRARLFRDCGRTPDCLAEAGGALGVDRIMVGVASRLGDAYSLSLRLVDARTRELLSKAQASLSGERNQMLGAMQVLIFELIDPRLLSGTLAIAIDMHGARVEVDGKLVGTTPLAAPLTLPPGEHTLKLSGPLMRDYFTFFTIQPGKTSTLNVNSEQVASLQAELEGSAPFYKRWWFWAAVGGAAAAAGGTFFLLSGSEAPSAPSTTMGNVSFR